MGETLINYMNQRLGSLTDSKCKTKLKTKTTSLITISREAGCSANEIASRFYHEINKSQPTTTKTKNWKCINKEIIFDSAEKLGLPPRKIKYVFNSERRSAMEEVVEAISSKYYKSDAVIRKTIIKLVRDYMKRGNTIIVGRAGVALSQEFSNAFHIKLMAPLDWRISQISKKHQVSEQDAREYIIKMDRKRQALIKEFLGRKPENSIFDIIFNCEKICEEEIVNISLQLMQARGIK